MAKSGIEKSSLSLGNIQKHMNVFRFGLNQAASTIVNINKSLFNRKKTNENLIKKDQFNFDKNQSAEKARLAEEQLEAKNINNITKQNKPEDAIKNNPKRGFLGRMMDFVGLLVGGWLVVNWKNILNLGKSFISRIMDVVGILKKFTSGVADFFGSIFGVFHKDLDAIAELGIFGISVGKIICAEDVETISKCLGEQESKIGLETGTLKLIPWIETAKGLIQCFEILNSDQRIIAAAFGAEDFTNDMGITRRADNHETIFARNHMAICARAAGVLALDTPFFGFKDSGGLETSALEAKTIGFKGKFAIHPSQIEQINRLFSPSKEEIDYARQVIKVFEESKSKGRGSTSLNGQVIDVPVVKRAKSILALYNEPVFDKSL